ncbi:MAG: hypothetical protein D4R65_10070 [Verrucomicrobiaceae bacterium]|nr:MAG: hypothetical protein D4R65_10070 [Verrucomicrobiaceae bacterium]
MVPPPCRRRSRRHFERPRWSRVPRLPGPARSGRVGGVRPGGPVGAPPGSPGLHRRESVSGTAPWK